MAHARPGRFPDDRKESHYVPSYGIVCYLHDVLMGYRYISDKGKEYLEYSRMERKPGNRNVHLGEVQREGLTTYLQELNAVIARWAQELEVQQRQPIQPLANFIPSITEAVPIRPDPLPVTASLPIAPNVEEVEVNMVSTAFENSLENRQAQKDAGNLPTAASTEVPVRRGETEYETVSKKAKRSKEKRLLTKEKITAMQSRRSCRGASTEQIRLRRPIRYRIVNR